MVHGSSPNNSCNPRFENYYLTKQEWLNF
jgi:hypothetical protein